jgi:hypothetical protein
MDKPILRPALVQKELETTHEEVVEEMTDYRQLKHDGEP